jgi:tetratricopeptide (TPR) repeat protein
MRSSHVTVLVLAALLASACRSSKRTDYDQMERESVPPPEMSEPEPAPPPEDPEDPADIGLEDVTLEDVTMGEEPPTEPEMLAGVEDEVEMQEPAAQPEPVAAQEPPTQEPALEEPALQDPQDVGEQAERIRLLRARQQALAAQYIARGDELLDSADLQGALEQYSQALDVMPSSQEARDRMRRVQALMGDRFPSAADFMQEAQMREVVRRSQARVAAEQASIEGDAALRRGDYETAIARYNEALLILRYHPLIATASLDERILDGKLNDAIALQAEQRAAQARQEAEEARAEAERREAVQVEYRRERIRTLFAEARMAFLRDDFARAEDLAQQILVDDPGNQAALALRDAAQDARHETLGASTRREYREQWLRTFDELDTMDVPQQDSLVFDDLKRWSDVVARQPLEFSIRDTIGAADKEAILERLETVRFSANFVGADGEGSPLSEIASYLQNLTGVNFLISNKVREDLDEEQRTIKLQLPERSVRKVLDIIADTSENLRWKIEDGVVKFVTKDELIGGQVLRFYEVRDIIHPVPSFPGREINVIPSGGVNLPDEEIEEQEGLVVTSDALETLIRDNISPESWNADPKNSVRITESGTMVVNQTPEVQEQILQLLDDLREATGIMVDIQARFLRVEDNFLEDIGIDWRGLGQPGLGTNAFLNDFGDASTQSELGKEIGTGTDLGAFYDEGQDGDIKGRVENLYDIGLGDQNVLTGTGGLSLQWTYLNDLQFEVILRAVAKSERAELVTAPRVLVFNTARSNIAVLNQVAYVQDFDVEIAQGASIADPIIKVVQDGVVLDVRPVVSADRRFITMELRPTVATLRRPIQEISTTLGSQQSITIQLPELDIQRVRTTVPMPDGGTVMLGGLKVSEKQDLRSGVPILNKVPLVRFLFERKGAFVTNRKLLILIKANIVIPEEHEPTKSQLGL